MTIADTEKYKVIDGERLDLIIYNHYQIEPVLLSPALNFILSKNPNLASFKQPFNLGSTLLIIDLPPLPVFDETVGDEVWR